jgi:SWI/SNF-related matrix-associated actin-dependent regulator of chromatin subfamily A-like protein 1
LTDKASPIKFVFTVMGKLIFEKNRFWFAGDNLTVAREAGFQWHKDSLRWVTRKVEKAVKLRRFADETCERKFKNAFIATQLAPPEQIIYSYRLTPKSWQIESAWWACTRSRSYIADEAGLGKTITAALCINSVPGKTLIVCPSFLVNNWRAELLKWTDRQTVSVIENGKPHSDEFKHPIIILPDSLVIHPLIRMHLSQHKFTWLFVDEAHRYKEATAQRTKSLVGSEDQDKEWYAIADSAERVCLLSGTPIPNGRPIELYPLLSQVAHEAIGFRTRDEFGKEFCDGKQVARQEGGRTILHWDFKGHSHLGRLRTELHDKLMIRHLKIDHLKELGPKTRKIIFLDEPKELKRFESRVLKQHTLHELMGEDHELGDIATYRREVGEAKVLPAYSYITELLESSRDKLVVFAHHISVVKDLTYMLSNFSPIMIRGGMTAKQKAKAVHLFQTDVSRRIIVGNMEAMGVGNTLTKAPGVVIVEPSWVPGINEQAEDRVHRMTQNSNVYVHYLVMRNSLDERMLSQALSKQKTITKVLD